MSYIGNTNNENWLTPREEFFSGNGTTTAFILTRQIFTLSDIVVSVNNVTQNRIESYNYNFTNNSVVFNEAPAVGTNNITIRYNARQVNLVIPAQGSVTQESLAAGAPRWDGNGDLFVEGNLTVDKDITANNFVGNGSEITDIQAESISTGTVGTSRLGSGTDVTTKFLRGDSTWQQVLTAFSTGNLGFTRALTTAGAVTLSGTLRTNNGGTGLTSFNSGGAVFASNTSTLTTGTLPVGSGGTGSTSLTANSILVGNGTNALQRIDPGASGNIVISNGTTWNSVNPLTTGLGKRGPRQTKFTSSGTFTVPADVDSIKVTVVGGGGGYVISPDLLYGSKGGEGGVAVRHVTGLTPGQTISVTIGALGNPLNAFSGYANTGGTSSFGSYCTATGGSGGYYDAFSIAQDGNSGTGTVGDFGVANFRFNLIGTQIHYGQGGFYNQSTPNGLVLVEY